MDKDLILRERERSLHMSRVPKETKEEFVNFADADFCGDRGLCFKSIWDNFKLWKMLFENIDMKLDRILEIVSQPQQKPEEDTSITMCSGKKVKGRKS